MSSGIHLIVELRRKINLQKAHTQRAHKAQTGERSSARKCKSPLQPQKRVRIDLVTDSSLGRFGGSRTGEAAWCTVTVEIGNIVRISSVGYFETANNERKSTIAENLQSRNVDIVDIVDGQSLESVADN